MNSAEVAARLTEAVGLFVAAVDEIPSAAWDSPSNLEGWSIRDLVAHTTGSVASLVKRVETGEAPAGPSDPADWKSEDPAGQIRELAARLRDGLAGADLDALRKALTVPVVGLSIHTWDVYRSLGRPFELPDDLLAYDRQVAESVPEEALRRPGVFGPAQPVPEGATPTARLMAFFGRPV